MMTSDEIKKQEVFIPAHLGSSECEVSKDIFITYVRDNGRIGLFNETTHTMGNTAEAPSSWIATTQANNNDEHRRCINPDYCSAFDLQVADSDEMLATFGRRYNNPPLPGTHLCIAPQPEKCTVSNGVQGRPNFGQSAIPFEEYMGGTGVVPVYCSYNPPDVKAEDLPAFQFKFSDPGNADALNTLTDDVCARYETESAMLSDSTNSCVSACVDHDRCNYFQPYCTDDGGLLSSTPLPGGKNTFGDMCDKWARKDSNYNNGNLQPSLRDKYENICKDYDYNPFLGDAANIGRGLSPDTIISADNLEYVKNLCGCLFNQQYYQDFSDALKKQGLMDPSQYQPMQCWLQECTTAIPPILKPNCPTTLNITNCIDKIDFDNAGKIDNVTFKQTDACKQIVGMMTCKQDSDCGAGLSCYAGKCTAAPPAAPPSGPPAAPPSGPPSKPSTPAAASAAHINVPLVVGLSVGALSVLAVIIIILLKRR